jgi:hypothetical protein
LDPSTGWRILNLVNVVVYERVRDHARWLEGFRKDAPNREGSMGGFIYQLKDDPNKHYIVFEWDDKGAADFINITKTPQMKKVFDDAGVLEQTFKLCSSIKFEK